MKQFAPFLALSLVFAAPSLAASPIQIVAAENFYGDVAKQIGGDAVDVISILSNPDQDPHLFEASPSVARDISSARILIYNGVDYDPWMEKLIGASPSPERKAIVVGELAARKPGDNPHIWYDPRNMLAMARALGEVLAKDDPSNAAVYKKRLAAFETSLQPVDEKIKQIKDRFAGLPVAATEPVFGYMFEALGMDVKEMSFQNSVMNDTEPSASDVAAFESDLKNHKIKLLVYNSQASDPVADRMKAVAEAAGVPVIGATETEPPGASYQLWMTSEVDELGKAAGKLTQ